MVGVVLTDAKSLEILDMLNEPTLTSDDSAKTADGQATHAVDVWLMPSSALARESNGIGQRVWYSFVTHEEARSWFSEVTIDHT